MLACSDQWLELLSFGVQGNGSCRFLHCSSTSKRWGVAKTGIFNGGLKAARSQRHGSPKPQPEGSEVPLWPFILTKFHRESLISPV